VRVQFAILGSGKVLERFWPQGETFWRFWRLWEPLQNRIDFADVLSHQICDYNMHSHIKSRFIRGYKQ
jgi:hypothetical protein